MRRSSYNFSLSPTPPRSPVNLWRQWQYDLNASGGLGRPPFSIEDGTLEEPWGLASHVHDEMTRVIRSIIPMPRLSIPESPPTPRFMGQWRNVQEPAEEEESRLTQGEQEKALKKLKKEIYNPAPKRMAKRASLYYRDGTSSTNQLDKNENQEDEDGKRCAICLEDFKPKQLVMLTPCNHMFHEDCIVPWVKSHGQCPVCRFAICERMRDHPVPMNNNIAEVLAHALLTGSFV